VGDPPFPRLNFSSPTLLAFTRALCPPADALPVVRSASSKLLRPPELDGVRLMSFGFVAKGASTGTTSAAIVRGPLASSTIQQLAAGTEWGELDFLIIDMPPGTGDIMLTLCQSIGLTAALVVSTPGRLAHADAVKGIELLRATKVPIVGLVENLAHFTDPEGRRHRLFGTSLQHELARAVNAAADGALADEALLAAAADASPPPPPPPRASGDDDASAEAAGCFSIPIEREVSEALERARPVVLDAPASAAAATFARLAAHVAGRALATRYGDESRPAVTYRATDQAVVLRFLSGRLEGREYAVPAATLRAHSLDAKSASLRATAGGGGGATRGAARDAGGGDGTVPLDISPRGNYGVAIRWDDGHDAAIYSYEQIVELAQGERGPDASAAAAASGCKT
jgi:Mrp family chromosome partitioning ATPase/DUF971 family protein